MYQSLWQSCLEVLEQELPQQQFNMWIRPLQIQGDEQNVTLYAPNRFVLDWVRDKYLNRINELLIEICGDEAPKLHFGVGSGTKPVVSSPPQEEQVAVETKEPSENKSRKVEEKPEVAGTCPAPCEQARCSNANNP